VIRQMQIFVCSNQFLCRSDSGGHGIFLATILPCPVQVSACIASIQAARDSR
jgi:hypothetical protein